MKIKKRDSAAILNSLSGAVVPNRGIQYIMVGRADEAKQIMTDLDNIKKALLLSSSLLVRSVVGKALFKDLLNNWHLMRGLSWLLLILPQREDCLGRKEKQ